MTEENPGLTETRALVALLRRAALGALSLSADISSETRLPTLPPGGDGADGHEDEDGDEDGEEDGGDEDDRLSRVLLAPGGSYRVENVTGAGGTGPAALRFVSDGTTPWAVTGNEAMQLPYTSPGLHLIWDLLAPSWLLAGFTLTLAGAAQAAGRPAWRVTGEKRPVASVQRASRGFGRQRFDHVEVLIDAELGILLRLEGSAGGEQLRLSEVRSLTVSPARAGDATQFQLPAGLTEAAYESDDLRSVFDGAGPAWRAVKTVAGVASDSLAFTIQHSRRAGPGDGVPPMPDPGPDSGAASPIGDELINLLHRTGLPPQRFAATGRKWTDGELLVRSMKRVRVAIGSMSALMGPEQIWDALASRPPSDTFEEIRLQLALPGRYRVDHLRHLPGRRENQEAAGSDGDRPWRLYPNRVVTGPPLPLGSGWDTVVDPAWLLLPDWQLSADGEEEIGGRRGWRVRASSSPGPGSAESTGFPEGGLSRLMYHQVAAVIDAELGIILRLAMLSDGQPAECWELTGLSTEPGDDAFRRPDLPGRRLVEDAGPLSHLDIPEPLRAVGKAGMAGVKLLGGLLSTSPGPRRENPKDVWDDASDS